ncbi:IFN protein, partial [Nicator chloris]|nr:IFN protein [Nicator chloris]
AVLTDLQPCLWYGTLVLLPGLTTIHVCKTPYPWDSLQLLQAMAPSIPQPCHHQQTPFLLPSFTPTAAAAIILCILQKLFTTLSSPNTPAHHHWHAKIRHHVLHHIQQLEQYVQASGILFEGQGPCNLLLSINKYFGCIQDFLCTHHHRPYAWDHVCLEAHTCFHLHNHTHIIC